MRSRDAVKVWSGRDTWIVTDVRPIGQTVIKSIALRNYVNYTLAVSLLNLLMQRGCSTTYPCFEVKKVGLYDANGNLIKTLPKQSYSTTKDQNTYWTNFTFYDSSTDQYTVKHMVLYGLQTGAPDSESNYMIIAKQTLSTAVSKASNASLNVLWRIGLDRTASLTMFGFWDDFANIFANSLIGGYGQLQGAYNLDLYYGNQTVIKTIPYSDGPFQGDEPSGYRVDIAFDDLTSQDYIACGFQLFTQTGTQRFNVAQYWTSQGVGKGTSPMRFWYRIRMYYDFVDTQSGVRNRWTG